MPFWVKFNDRSDACVAKGTEAESRKVAEEHGEVLSIESLPYPARPIIGEKGDCPPFCHDPQHCRGRTSCPQNYACSE